MGASFHFVICCVYFLVWGAGLYPQMDFFLDSYLNTREERQTIIAISPLRVANHTRVPDTLIVTAEFDVLKDEGIAYAKQLERANVHVIHKHLSDCSHGFIGMARYSPATQSRLDEVCALLVDYANQARRQ